MFVYGSCVHACSVWMFWYSAVWDLEYWFTVTGVGFRGGMSGIPVSDAHFHVCMHVCLPIMYMHPSIHREIHA